MRICHWKAWWHSWSILTDLSNATDIHDSFYQERNDDMFINAGWVLEAMGERGRLLPYTCTDLHPACHEHEKLGNLHKASLKHSLLLYLYSDSNFHTCVVFYYSWLTLPVDKAVAKQTEISWDMCRGLNELQSTTLIMFVWRSRRVVCLETITLKFHQNVLPILYLFQHFINPGIHNCLNDFLDEIMMQYGIMYCLY